MYYPMFKRSSYHTVSFLAHPDGNLDQCSCIDLCFHSDDELFCFSVDDTDYYVFIEGEEV